MPNKEGGTRPPVGVPPSRHPSVACGQQQITRPETWNFWDSHSDQGETSMMKLIRRIGFSLFAMLAIVAGVGHAPAAVQERFEVKSIKAVRPHLADTVAALQQRDLAKAKAAFEAYDS